MLAADGYCTIVAPRVSATRVGRNDKADDRRRRATHRQVGQEPAMRNVSRRGAVLSALVVALTGEAWAVVAQPAARYAMSACAARTTSRGGSPASESAVMIAGALPQAVGAACGAVGCHCAGDTSVPQIVRVGRSAATSRSSQRRARISPM